MATSSEGSVVHSNIEITSNNEGKSKETMANRKLDSNNEIKLKLFPTVAMYGPYNVKDLEPGKIMKWCTCGLSKKQPWCDGAHKKTGFKSLKWKVPETPQKMYSLCGCKYTSSPPLCDGTHNDMPCKFIAQKEACQRTHSDDIKLCTGCGWVPQW